MSAGFPRLTWPKAWASQQRKRKLGLLLGFPAAAMFFVLGGAVMWAEGEMGGAVLAGAAGVVLITLLPSAYLVQVGCRSRSYAAVYPRKVRSTGELMAFVPYAKSTQYARWLWQPIQLAFFAVWPLLAAAIEPSNSRNYRGIQTIAMIVPFVIPFLVPRLFSYFLRGRRPMGIGLTSAGVYVWSWFGRCFYRWDDIAGVGVSEKRGPIIELRTVERLARDQRDQEENWLSGFGPFRDWMSRIEAGYLAVDPVLAYRALQFYLVKPSLRADLGTEAGVERIRSADLELDQPTYRVQPFGG